MAASYNPNTPINPSSLTKTSDLSPPSSQGNTSTTSPTMANANGKRPLSTSEENIDAMTRTSNASAAAAEPAEVKTHEPSGYTWSRPEDAPGYSWNNKRALEDATRAWENILHKDHKVGNRFGDPFEMADSEIATLASQRQR